MRVAAGILLALAFLGALVYMTLQQSGTECEVCMEFEGRRACNTSSAPDRATALAQATSSACAVISGGVTQGMQCNRTPPASSTCRP